MISYQAAVELILSEADRLIEEESVSLGSAIRRVVARKIICEEDSPPFSNSAMDGFAVFSSELDTALGMSVVRTIAAGNAPVRFSETGIAVEIMTGAPMPEGSFDAVVKIEDVEVERDGAGNATKVYFKRKAVKGENVRLQGEDYQAGQILAEQGTRINSAHVMAFAALGVAEVPVRRKPRVAVLSTGKELVHYSTKRLQPGMIRNSTEPYLMAALAELGAEARFYGIVQDDVKSFVDVVDQAMADRPDVVISTGAVSMGKYDFVKPALEEMGAEIVFHKASIRPGKPILFSRLGDRRVAFFGIPGNPISTAVGLRFFVAPYLRKISGLVPEAAATATLIEDCKKPDGLTCFFKAEVSIEDERLVVKALAGQASFMMSPLTKANAWVLLPEAGGIVPRGTRVQVYALDASTTTGGVF